jgi:FkbM family methyltransferase
MLRSFFVTTLYRLTSVPVAFPRDLSAKWLELTNLRRFLADQRMNVVLDVGANEGQFATKLRRLGFTGFIASFEPDPRPYSRLVQRHGRDPAWRGYQIALGDADTETAFHLAKDSVLSSFLSPTDPENVSSTIRVPVRRLDGIVAEVLESIPTPRVLLKTDTQGFDLNVLRGASGCIDLITGILAELSVLPIYEQSPPFHEAIRAYQDTGFDLVDLSLVTRSVDGRVLELDGLFVRRPPGTLAPRAVGEQGAVNRPQIMDHATT